MLNQLLGGHYLVIQALQEGGLAKTYIAEDHYRPGHPKCAVKLLKPASDQPDFLPTARRLFHQEAEILEKLGQHDQIPRLLAYFEENQEFYLVQEFIKGHTLSQEMPKGHRWSEIKVINMLHDVLTTLEFVHSHGVIHRDIKPNNLIRRQQDNKLVLIDFGAVKQIRTPKNGSKLLLSHRTVSIGTQGYMPTEQVRGKPRLNSDIYALGMIGIQALTGVYPIDLPEDAEGEVIWREMATVSDRLAMILFNMTRYHFKDRYQSVAEVLQELQTITAQNLESASEEVVSESVEEDQNVSSNLVAAVPKMEKEVGVAELWETKLLVAPNSSSSKDPDLKQNNDSILFRINKFCRFYKSQMLIGTGIISIFIGILAGYNHIQTLRRQAEKALVQIEELQAQGKYPQCLQQAETFTQDHSYLRDQAKSLWEQCYQAQAEVKLGEAEELAKQSLFKDAIALANQIPEDTDAHSEATKLTSQWAEQMLQIASNKYQEGKIEEAIAIAEAIPGDEIFREEIDKKTQQWQEEWQKNQNHLKMAQQKLDERLWSDAIEEAKKLSNTDYWQEKSQPIIDQAKKAIEAEKAAASRRQYTLSRPNPRPRTQYQQPKSNPNPRPRTQYQQPKSNPNPRPRTQYQQPKPQQPKSNTPPVPPKPRHTSTMTCKYIGNHPKCPRR